MLEQLLDFVKQHGFEAYLDKPFLKDFRKFIRDREPNGKLLAKKGLLIEIPSKKQLTHLQTQLHSLIIFFRTEGHLNIANTDFAFIQTYNALEALKEESPIQYEALHAVVALKTEQPKQEESTETSTKIVTESDSDHAKRQSKKDSAQPRKRKTTKSILRHVRDPIWKRNFNKMKDYMDTVGDRNGMTLNDSANLIWIEKQEAQFNKGLLSEHQVLLLNKIGLLH